MTRGRARRLAAAAPPKTGVSLALLPGPSTEVATESGPLRAVHLSRHKWPGGLVDQDSRRLNESTKSSSMVLERESAVLSDTRFPTSRQDARSAEQDTSVVTLLEWGPSSLASARDSQSALGAIVFSLTSLT